MSGLVIQQLWHAEKYTQGLISSKTVMMAAAERHDYDKDQALIGLAS